MKITLVTSNKGKIGEISEMLKIPLDFAKLEIDEVQSMDLEYVAKKKAQAAYASLKKPLIIDDVGVYIKAWNSLPGPFVKYTYLLMGLPKILDLMKNEKDRSLVVKCVVVYHDGKTMHAFVGSVKGKLSKKVLGINGWGFDPIIIPDGQVQTFAQMGFKKKNKISHRAKAFKKLKKFLDSQGK